MGEKPVKTFEERLHSLEIGCIIIGLLQVFSLVSAINSFSNGTGGLGTVILSALILLDIILAYYYTSKLNPIGPTLEYVFGVLLIIDGIILCITIILAILGIIYIILGCGILKEANYFRAYIQEYQKNGGNGGNIDNRNPEV